MSNEGDVDQNITGNDNVQIHSENDSIIAIGSGSMAAGRDIIIHSNDRDMVEILKRQIQLLEDSLENSKRETKNERKRYFAAKASNLAIELGNNEYIEFSSWKMVELGVTSMQAGRLEIAEGQFKQAERKFKSEKDSLGLANVLGNLGVFQIFVANIRNRLNSILKQ